MFGLQLNQKTMTIKTVALYILGSHDSRLPYFRLPDVSSYLLTPPRGACAESAGPSARPAVPPTVGARPCGLACRDPGVSGIHVAVGGSGFVPVGGGVPVAVHDA